MKPLLYRMWDSRKFIGYRQWLVIWMLCTCLPLHSCSSPSAKIHSPDTPDALVAALDQAGAEVRRGEEVGAVAHGLVPQALHVNQELIWVYYSPEAIAPSGIDTAFEPGHFLWVNEHMIVEYSGNDGGTILLMEGLMGEPAMQPAAAGEEPYPPAIPAAIRLVAGDLGGQPAEIEVLTYDMVEWRDSCLDLPQANEECDEETTDGWRILMQFEGVTIEAHTDMLGETVRWRPR
jgi:hypothetical protein